jgi:hypothetical protein
MPLFRLDTPTEVKLVSVTPRSEQHGTDLVSALTLGFELKGPNTLLDLLSPTLRQAIYTVADDETPTLEGIPAPTPKLRTKHLGALPLSINAIEGGTLFVEWGIGEDMALSKCKVDRWRAECMEGGTVSLAFRVSTNDVDETEAGRLFGKLGQTIAIRFEPPAASVEPVQTGQTIDGTKGPGLFEVQDEPEKSVEEVFAEQHAPAKKKGRKQAEAA